MVGVSFASSSSASSPWLFFYNPHCTHDVSPMVSPFLHPPGCLPSTKSSRQSSHLSTREHCQACKTSSVWMGSCKKSVVLKPSMSGPHIAFRLGILCSYCATRSAQLPGATAATLGGCFPGLYLCLSHSMASCGVSLHQMEASQGAGVFDPIAWLVTEAGLDVPAFWT